MDIKKYLNKKIIFFFVFGYIRNLKMINIEYLKCSPTSINDIADKKLKAHLKSIPTPIDEIKDKKIQRI